MGCGSVALAVLHVDLSTKAPYVAAWVSSQPAGCVPRKSISRTGRCRLLKAQPYTSLVWAF